MEKGLGERLTRGLTVRYIMVLVVLAGLSLGAYLVLKQVIADNESSAALINVSGRQRMLSQRVALLAESLSSIAESTERDAFLRSMIQSIDLMERSHDALTRGDPKMNLPAAMSEELRSLYFGPEAFVDREVRSYLDRAREYASLPEGDRIPYNRDLVYILKAVRSGGLLNSLDAIVTQHQLESERRIASLQRIQVYVLLLILAVLATSALGVFRPMVGRIGRNIAELRARDDKLRRANKRLESQSIKLSQANKVLSEYAYAVSHDLKGPLRAIHNYSDFLVEDLGATLEVEQQSYLDGLVKATLQADELIEDLLAYGQVGTGEATYDEVDLGDFVRRAVDSLSLPEGAEVVVAADWPTIEISPPLLRQIVLNLLSNALKFGHRGQQRVEIGCQVGDEEHCEIFVKDNGIGIDERHFEQIFEIFKRLHTREDYEGTGIGLAIVKKAAERLGGRIRIESEPGAGSVFTVSLPMKKEEEPDEE